MKLAFLYAGQGSQRPGMGRDLYEAFPQVRPIFGRRPLGLDLTHLCFDADADTLAQTAHTQPCMGAFAAAVTLLLREQGIVPGAAMGLSLGEYGALHAAGALSAEALIDLLAFRGRAMTDAAAGIESAMMAVFADAALVERAVADTPGRVWCCNYNSPGQVVIGGEVGAVTAAADACKAAGARRCIPLKVGGPFHTPLMAPAGQQLAQRLEETPPGPLVIPVMFNVTGGPLPPDMDVARALAMQVQAPVRFEAGLRALLDMGVDTFVEIGPGNVLAGLVKKIAPHAAVYSVDDRPSLETAAAAVKEKL